MYAKQTTLCGRAGKKKHQRLDWGSDENTLTGRRIWDLEQVSELLDESRLLTSSSIDQADRESE